MTLTEKQKRGLWIVTLYPVAVFVVALLLALILPSTAGEGELSYSTVLATVVAALILLINHLALMTATERCRVCFNLFATPEEWQAANAEPEQASSLAKQELQRTHNAHRNATENTVPFAVLLVPFLMLNPPAITAWVWLMLFSVGRLGHGWSFLFAKDNLRGLFMTLSLLGLCGMSATMLLGMVAY